MKIHDCCSTADGLVVGVQRHEAVSQHCAQRAVEAVSGVLGRYRFGGSLRLRLQRIMFADDGIVAQLNYRSPRVTVRIQVPIVAEDGIEAIADRLDCHIRRQLTGRPLRSWPDPQRPVVGFVSECRPITRRKRFHLMVLEPHIAAAVMDTFDFDAHLFIDAETGQDAVVYWAGPLGVRLARQSKMAPLSTAGMMTVNPIPTLCLSEQAAIQRVCMYGLPFLFFTDVRDGRGRLLYRRYAGDLGLVQGRATAPGR
ncbi:hypothetical protein HGA07_15960 [Nocardia veterana]|uniref:Sigma 54 modulation/S30EA ribosomal protein C-terminal domain-containing protein n=3 Tax=Nocardia veterana TaxID=132249 RepID=A0A7X6RJ13_9NOCA|nr:hypothetical protein [Nocardia veterana]